MGFDQQLNVCPDVWLKIFSYLKLRDISRFRLVCKLWNQLIIDHVLKPRKQLIICLIHYSINNFFRKEHISDCYYVSNYRQLMPSMEHHQELLQSLKVFNFLIGNWFLEIPFQRLHSITFVDCTFTECFTGITLQLKDLTKLEIMKCEISDEHIKIIANNLSQLEHLNVSFNNNLSGANFGTLPITIRSLNISYCMHLNDFKLCYSFQELLTKGAKLEAIRLKPYPAFANTNCLPNTSFFVLTTLKHLRILKLNCMADINMIHGSVPEIVEVEHLTIFGRRSSNESAPMLLAGRPNDGDQFIRWLFSVPFPNLRYLNLVSFSPHYTTDESILYCLRSCPNLVRLKLNNLPFLTSKSLDFIAELTELRYLKFCNIDLSDQIVIRILKQCHELQHLIIQFADHGTVKPYNLTEAIIHECIYLCDKFPDRQLKVVISKSLLPTDKLFTIPKNLKLEISRSRFLIRKHVIYVDEPIQ